MESPARTEAILRHLVTNYGADSVQFYDMNFFLREDHARELAERITPLNLRWWCEARLDTMSKYSDETFAALRRAGCTMIFFGAESGSDWALKEMQKDITTAQTLEVARRIRHFDIIPEFSFVIGNPKDPERDTHETLKFIRTLKRINQKSEIIMYHYTPVPQRTAMYGDIDSQMAFPTTPDEWATKRWMDFTVRIDPNTPWLKRKTKNLIDNFELVVSSRWPTVQDIRAPRWGRAMLKTLSAWRYTLRLYSYPQELRWAHQWINLRKPKQESL
jgi:anaerobic magnesium-protoporphyrin IX monomethyl ester cyclase